MKYKLRVQCEIQQTDDNGGYYGQGLRVEETIDIGATTFMEIAGVLGQYHELGEIIKRAQRLEAEVKF